MYTHLKNILNILSQRISGDFINTNDGRHVDFFSFNVKYPTIYTHAHFQTVVK